MLRSRLRRLPIVALLLWGLFAFVVPSFVQALNLVDVFAFPLGYFMAAQGVSDRLRHRSVCCRRGGRIAATLAAGRTFDMPLDGTAQRRLAHGRGWFSPDSR